MEEIKVKQIRFIGNVQIVHAKQEFGQMAIKLWHSLEKDDHLPNFEKNQLFKSELETKNKVINSQIESRELYIQQHQLHSTEVVAQSKSYDAFRKEAMRSRNKERDCTQRL